MNKFISDVKHMWWLFTVYMKSKLSGDYDGAEEALFWMKMHWKHDSEKIRSDKAWTK